MKAIKFFLCWQLQFSSVQFTCSVMSKFLRPHGLQHARPPCSSPTRRVYSNSCPLSRWCHPTISSSVVPFSSPLQSFPASGAFQMSQLFTWGGQRTGVSASASVLPMKTQDWSPLGWAGWISEQSKGLESLLQHFSHGGVCVSVGLFSLSPSSSPAMATHMCSLYLCKYCLNRYTWNLKKWCWWTHLLSRNIGAEVVLKLLDVKVSRHKIHGQSWHALYEVKEAHSKCYRK